MTYIIQPNFFSKLFVDFCLKRHLCKIRYGLIKLSIIETLQQQSIEILTSFIKKFYILYYKFLHFYYKFDKFYYKIRQALLQNSTCFFSPDVDSCTISIPSNTSVGGVQLISSGICGKHGLCISKPGGGFECSCSPGFTGDFCHRS